MKTKISARKFLSKYMIYLAFVALLIVFSLTLRNVGNGFLDMGNVWNIIRQTALIAILGVGMTYALGAGQIDLSVGSVVGLTSLVTAWTVQAAGLIPGVLKVKVKVNEVITTIMLNTVAASFCQYLAKGPWKNANKNMVAATEQLNARYWFGGLIGGSNLSTAILAAAVLALVIWYVMQKTSRGYEMKLTGQNERFARFIGIRTDRLVLVCMLLSGALCGLVGMFRVYGAEHLFRDSISRDYYFEGLMVAMIARYQPLAVVFLSLFFAALKIGAQGMELAAGVPNQIYLIIQTVVIFLMAAESGLFGALQNRVRKGKEAGKHA